MDRKFTRFFISLFFLFNFAIPLITSALTTKEIQDAIDTGIRTKKQRHHGLNLEDQTVNVLNGIININRPTWAWREEKGFTVELFTPITWIEQMAADATRDYKEFTQADVTDDMKRPVLFVLVYGRQGKDFEHLFGDSVHHVVLRSEDRRSVIQPLEIRSFSDEKQNLFGAKEDYIGKTVTFNLADVQSLRSKTPDGEFFLTVIGERTEKNFKIKTKHFARLPMPGSIEAAMPSPTNQSPNNEAELRTSEGNSQKPDQSMQQVEPKAEHVASAPRNIEPITTKANNSASEMPESPPPPVKDSKTDLQYTQPLPPTRRSIMSSDLRSVTTGIEILRVKDLLGEPSAISKANMKTGIPASWEYILNDGSIARIYFKQGRVQSVYVTGSTKLAARTIQFETIDQLRGKQFFIKIPIYVKFVSTDPVTYIDESKGIYYLQNTPSGLTLEFRDFDASKSKYGAIYQESVTIREAEWIVNQTTLVMESVKPPKRSATLTFRFSSVDEFWKFFNQCFTKSPE